LTGHQPRAGGRFFSGERHPLCRRAKVSKKVKTFALKTPKRCKGQLKKFNSCTVYRESVQKSVIN
ncbi:hypothetical protein, partial [Jeotgalibaca porci]|uniref:hypothetical protein n=1 Tax=Jeotgalibaca porci TaxID=1868793 RepID=UPI00359F7A59